MPCVKYDRTMLSAFQDGELDYEESVMIKKHLKECRECAAVFASFQRVTDALTQYYREKLCPDEEALAAYTEGSLPQEWMGRIERHLEECPQCRDEVETLQAVSLPRVGVGSPVELRWAASDENQIRQRIGAEFEERSPIDLKLYSARLYVVDRNSALLAFRKGGKPASDLNGRTVDFFLIKDPSITFSETIQKERVEIDFGKLGTTIEGYAKVALRIHLDESTVIEESLGNGQSC